MALWKGEPCDNSWYGMKIHLRSCMYDWPELAYFSVPDWRSLACPWVFWTGRYVRSLRHWPYPVCDLAGPAASVGCQPENIITYLVSCRRSIEIWRVCKIYGRRGGAEPSIYFTNSPYFYRPSATDQISVLFRRGPWIMYVVAKIGKNQSRLHTGTYTAGFCARKCDVTTCADDVIGYAMKIKDETMLCLC